MARVDFIDTLYSKNKSALEFNFDMLLAPPILSYLSYQDIAALHNIATSLKYSSDINLKYKEIDKIMTSRGFKKFVSGTNRVAYSFLEDQSIIMKVAVDKVGLNDNPAEFKNQFIFKPFVTKVFEVSPCGTVGLFERVMPITRIQEFKSVADDIFDIITEKIIGKYVVDDFGTKYFMNWGLRPGFGPCLLDFPYVFELDGNKLYCNKRDMTTGVYCGGVIDYNDGFNTLVCTKCGKEYKAKELETNKQEKLIIIKGECVMKVQLVKEGKVIYDPQSSSDSIQKPINTRKEKNHNSRNVIKVSLNKVADGPTSKAEPSEEEIRKERAYEDHTARKLFNTRSKFISDVDTDDEYEPEIDEAESVSEDEDESDTDDKWNDVIPDDYDDEAPRNQKFRKGGKKRKFNPSDMGDF